MISSRYLSTGKLCWSRYIIVNKWPIFNKIIDIITNIINSWNVHCDPRAIRTLFISELSQSVTALKSNSKKKREKKDNWIWILKTKASIFQNQGKPPCLGAASSCLAWPRMALPCHALSCLVLSCLGLNVTLFVKYIKWNSYVGAVLMRFFFLLYLQFD